MKNFFYSIGLIFCLFLTNKGIAQNYNLYGYFFYTIAKNTEWPQSYRSGEFVLAIIGDSPAEKSLIQLALKQKINGQNIKLAKYSDVDDIGKCHMLYIPEQNSYKLDEIIEKTKTTSTLLVTEKEGLAMEGSCVNFVMVDDKMAFELNREAFADRKLKPLKELTKFAIIN